MNHLPNAPRTPTLNSTQAEISNWLDAELEGLLARRSEVVDGLNKTLEAFPRIDTDEAQGIAGENVDFANKLIKAAETRFKLHKEPYLTGGRAVDGWYKKFGAPLTTALAEIKERMNDYVRRTEAAARRKAQAEREAAEADAQRLADLAMQSKNPEVQAAAFDELEIVADRAQRIAANLNAPPAGRTRVHGTYGAVISARRRWLWRTTDLALVPREYLMIDKDKVNEAMKARGEGGRPTATIPGIEFYEELTAGVRA
jgi:hypothetical protein